MRVCSPSALGDADTHRRSEAGRGGVAEQVPGDDGVAEGHVAFNGPPSALDEDEVLGGYFAG
jgi:hypothetical protein